MELVIIRGPDGPEFSIVTKRCRENRGTLIVAQNKNHVLRTRVLSAENIDEYKSALSINIVMFSTLAQADAEGRRCAFLDEITDFRANFKESYQQDAIVKS